MGLKQSLIENNSIQLQAKANNWREAIKIGTDMLIASGAITPARGDHRQCRAARPLLLRW